MEEIKSPSADTGVESRSLLDLAEVENGQSIVRSYPSVTEAAMSMPPIFTAVSSCEFNQHPVTEAYFGAPSQLHRVLDRSNLPGVVAQRHAECPCCIPRRVIYHPCGGASYVEPVPLSDYPLSPGSLPVPVSLATLQESGDGKLTYSAQSPVSVTHIQRTAPIRGSIPFGSQPPGTTQSPPYQHECPGCSTTLEKHPEVDPYLGGCSDPHSPSGSRRFSAGAGDLPRHCPIHGTESFVTSFNPTFDIPLTLTYSSFSGHHPYLPHYYIQQPHRHQHQHHPVAAAHVPYGPLHAGGHHHCCSAVYHEGPSECRCQFCSRYDAKVPMIPDDRFHGNISTETTGSPLPSCALNQHEESSVKVSEHSMASADENVLPMLPNGVESSGDSVEAVQPSSIEIQPSEAVVAMDEPVCAVLNRIRAPEAFTIPADFESTIEPESTAESLDSSVQENDALTLRERRYESFVFDTDGSSVEGNQLQMSHLRSHSTDFVRSHTPPERDTNPSSLESEQANVAKVENGVRQQEMPSGRGMAFTIDFGHNLDSPEITEHWKQFTPYRTHAGIQERATKSKIRLKEKSESVESDRHQQKRTSISSSTGGDGSKSTRRRSPGSRSVGGYVSDGRASGISSDNEDASICSEVMGCIQGRRKPTRLSDPRSLLDRSYPSKSQPSLVKTKPSSHYTQSTASPRTSRGTTATKSSKAQPSGAAASTKPASSVRKTTDTKPSSDKSTHSKTDSSKRGATSTAKAPESSQGRRLPKKPSSDLPVDEKDEEILDVTSYLINRMLYSSDGASNGYKTKPRPVSGGAARAGSTKSASRPARSSKKRDGDDNVSETGTYTIEDDPAAGEVQKARKDIDVVFGVGDAEQEHLVRPVIDSVDNACPERTGGERDTSKSAVTGEEDVFEYEPTDVQDELKQQVTEAVSSAISATKAIQKALLKKSSRGHGSPDVGDVAAASQSPASSRSLPSDAKTLHNQTSQPDASALPKRERASDAVEDRDFGTFTVCFDAPSPRLRDSRSVSLSRDDPPASVDDTTAESDRTSSRGEAEAAAQRSSDHEVNRSEYASDVQSLMQSVDAAVQELHDQICKKGESSKSASSFVVKKPTRESTFVKDAVAGSNQLKESSSGEKSASSSRRWLPEIDASDAGSESETGSLSSMDYSTTSSRFTRASLLRSSGSKSANIVPRVNRTFALRCSKAGSTESESTSSLVPRSRSAGTDNRLVLRDASSRSTSRTRSRSNALSPANDLARRQLGGAATSRGQKSATRRRDLDQQHSEDSSASICSSISSRSSTNFVRKDGGRYSMRAERSTVGVVPDPNKSRSVSKPKSAGSRLHQSPSLSRDRPNSSGSQRQLAVAPSSELNAWKRRKQYDPRKAVAEAKAKGSGGSKPDNGSLSEPEDSVSSSASRSFTAVDRHRAKQPTRADEIAQLSNAVAYNLNVLAESTKKDAVTLDDVGLQQLPVFSCDSSRSAFTAPRIADTHKARSIPIVTSDHVTPGEDAEKSSYDNVLVNSIQQVSRKVKVLTDQLITKVRDEKRRTVSGEVALPSPMSSGAIPTWENTSPELASILDNLKRTEQHLQVVHRALFVDGSKSRPTETRRSQTSERQRTAAESGGFRPIERPTSGGGVKKRTPSKKQTPLSTNPLSGDEYY